MMTQTRAMECKVMPLMTPVVIKGDEAIAGSLARMSADSNHPFSENRRISDPADFQQWGDWDNGHSDG